MKRAAKPKPTVLEELRESLGNKMASAALRLSEALETEFGANVDATPLSVSMHGVSSALRAAADEAEKYASALDAEETKGDFCKLVRRGIVSPDRKARFHKEGAALLRKLLKKLGGKGEVYSNKGGIAVPGEVCLKTPKLWLQIVGWDGKVLFRAASKEDPWGTRSANNWAEVEALKDLSGFAEKLNNLSKAG